jgi:hypothetical protein
MESDDFEKALPVALKLSKAHDLPCRVLKQGDLYAICFQDKAVPKGIVYGHVYEKELTKSLSKYAITDVVYLKKEEFEQGSNFDQPIE